MSSRTDLHDRTVDRLFTALQSFLSAESEYFVLRHVRWAPHDDFPNDSYVFDIAIAHGSPSIEIRDGVVHLARGIEVATVIDVIDEDWEAELYDKPDSLGFSTAYEYVVFDPSSDRLRPNLLALRKRDGSFQRVRSASSGIFFSSAGFRFDVRGTELTVSECGRPWDEEELLKCRHAWTKCPTPQLSEKIRRLEEKVRPPRQRLAE